MKNWILLSLFAALGILSLKAQEQVSVTFSTDFTEADIHLFVEDNTVSSLLHILETEGVYLIYEPTATFSTGISVPLTRVGESLVYSSAPLTLEKNTLYEYYFQIGTDGYFQEGLYDDMARLAVGYYRFLYTNTTSETLVLEPLTFNGTAPAGKKLARVKVNMSGVNVSENGVFAASGNTVVPLVNTQLAVNPGNTQNIYEGLLYAPTGSDITYTFYNGSIPENRLIDDNTYTVQLNSDTEKNPVNFSTVSVYEAAHHDFYDPDYIQRIEIKFAESDWAEILSYNKDNALDKYLRSEWVKINGVTLPGAGVKYKGNSSYSSGRAKNPFNISLDEFVSTNKYQDFTSFKLANIFGDPSFVREVLSYEIINQYMVSGKCNFAQVYVNGQYLGLYSNTETVNKSFCNRHFGSKNNTFVDCSPVNSPTVATKSNFQYISNNPSDYEASYELKVGDWSKFIALCNTVTNNPSELEKIMDMDKFLWYLAFNNIAVSIDSYVGVYSQNHYVYQNSEGRFMTIPWDFNMSFGAFNNIGNGNRLYQLNTTQRQQLALDVHSDDDYWPMIKNIYGNDRWKKMYLAHCKTIYKDYFENDTYLQSIQRWQSLAEQSVGADVNKFYSLNAFYASLTDDYAVSGYAVNGIKTLMDARKTYLSNLPEFSAAQATLDEPVVRNENNNVKFTVRSHNADRVFLYYRKKGDGNNAFSSVEMNFSDGAYSATVTPQSDITEYYFYAENSTIGTFLPSNAAFKFFTFDKNAPGEITKSEWAEWTDFKVYPNPVEAVLYVNLQEACSYRIINAAGEIVLSGYAPGQSSFEIQVHHLPQGLYILSLNTGAQIKSLKFLKH